MSPSRRTKLSLLALWCFAVAAPADLDAEGFEWWTSDRIAESHAATGTSIVLGRAKFANMRAEIEGMHKLTILRQAERNRLAKLCGLPAIRAKRESERTTRRLPGGGSSTKTSSSGMLNDAMILATHSVDREITVLVSARDPVRWARHYLDELVQEAEKNGVFKSDAQRTKVLLRIEKRMAPELDKLRRERLALLGWEASSVSGLGVSKSRGSIGRKESQLDAMGRAEVALDAAIKGLLGEWKHHARVLGLSKKEMDAIAGNELIARAKLAARLTPVQYHSGGGRIFCRVSVMGSDWMDTLIRGLEKQSLKAKDPARDDSAFLGAMNKTLEEEKEAAKPASKAVKNVLKNMDSH